MKSIVRPMLALFIALMVLTGVAYPLVVTGIAQAVFPHQAAGSLIKQDGKVVGSELIGQQFDAPQYFWGRLSATSPMPYNASASSGSNLGPTNPALIANVQGRLDALKAADASNKVAPPVDLVTASGSGLDPAITPEAAEFQIARVAKARNLKPDVVRNLVTEFTDGRQFGILGEPQVNVLKLNLALDGLHH
ncbi:potassium-transporting ATPase subunit KdpC [Pararobbsia alpina]|uniref:Potassium-transporting ATPase KdpC subunit n=1 Tax=Pararobbsia alpina TaxID=621374 RepID=A0A6S7BBL1_9BURK|nr:potassium-transporting ATPase subunit KdpC [Pararobbsia alpina]CAB3785647.1 Potassium-transporting ATPase KdpC subunit [Pararobbsia alpina]